MIKQYWGLLFVFFWLTATEEVKSQQNITTDSSKYYLDKIRAFQRSDMDSAEFYVAKTLVWAETNQQPSLEVNIYLSLGDIYYYKNEREKSFELLTMALDICDSNGLDKEKADVFYSMGLHFSRSSRMRDQSSDTAKILSALEFYDKGIQISEKLENLTLASKGYNLSGVLFDRLGNLEKAIEYFDKSEMYSRQDNDSIGLGYTLDYAGATHTRLNNYARAEKMFMEALHIRERLDDRFAYAINLNNLGEFYLDQNKQERAIEYLEKSLDISFEKKYNDLARHTLSLLSDLYIGKGLYARAYDLKTKEDKIKDELYALERARYSEEMEAKYESELKDRELAEKELVIALKNSEIARNRWIVTGLVASIFLLLVIGLLFQNRLKHKQSAQLEKANALAREAQIAAVITSQENERNRFARDLHDTFGQLISILNMNIGSIKDSKPSPEKREEVFNASTAVLNDMYDELKNVCFDLMPQSLIKGGVLPALQEFAARINTAEKVFVETDFFGLDERLTELHEISLYRISQEWVNNILKYSDADKVTIQLTRDEGELTLLIEDNGSGFDATKLTVGKGNGWKNIQSRANLVRGEVELDTVMGRKGNTLIMNCPVVKATSQVEKIPS